MLKIGTLTALLASGLAVTLLASCSTRMPSLPELPALPAVPLLSPGPVAGDPACSGSWGLENGGGLAVTASQEGLRWRSLEGETGRFVFEKDTWQAYAGWTDQPELRQIEFTCETGLTQFEGASAQLVAVIRQDTEFKGAKGTRLSGRLILPAGDAPVPIVVQVQPAVRNSALDRDPFQHLLPLQGIGVFLYDTRGTGISKGNYTQDFGVLATDAAAAAIEAKRLAGTRLGRFGLHGMGQGGWVAPMAAQTVKPDFLIVSNGLIESPLAENRAQSVQDVAEAGYGPEAQMAAGLLADAAGAVVTSDFKTGYVEVEALKNIYRKEPWYRLVKGEFTGDVLQNSDLVTRVAGPLRSSGTSWRHEGEPVLRKISIPVLWVLAGADREAPPAYTRSRLKTLLYEGRAITIADYPGYDHAMRGFDILPDGTRQHTHLARDYFRMVADFASGAPILPGGYEEAVISGPR